MIGNDIIDLKAAASQSDPTRKNYISRIFTEKEQIILKNSEKAVMQVWILWAMKEAAYKANQRRLDLQRNFNPRKLECIFVDQSSTLVKGIVTVEELEYHSVVSITKEYIHAFATPLQQEDLISDIFIGPVNLKEEFLLAFSSLSKVPKRYLSIQKNQNQVPYIHVKGRRIEQAFSLSHHGNFSGFTLPLMNY